MAYTILIHVANEDAIMAEVDELPAATDTWLKIANPRRKDNKDLHYLLNDVTTIMLPIWRISFVEILPNKDEEEIITTVREDRTRY